MKMKKSYTALLTILLCTLAQVLVAQDQPPQERRQRMDPARLGQMEKKILMDSITSLSEDQKILIEEVYKNMTGAAQSAFEENGQDRQAMRTALENIRKNKNEALKEILSVQQFDHFQKIMEDLRERRQNRRRQRSND